MTRRVYIGVDPGPIPGFARLTYSNDQLVERVVLQCTPELTHEVVRMLLREPADPRPWLQVERFVDSARTGRSRNRSDHDTTREVAAQARHAALGAPGVVVNTTTRRAVDVKPWATDQRLAAAGLLEPTKGMPHARDAARHALFLAASIGRPDPLSNTTTN